VELLPQLYNRVLTVPSVLTELTHERTPIEVVRWVRQPPAWLEVASPMSLAGAPKLGSGESEAIALAVELHSDVLLIDDRRGAAAAKGRGLHTTGTLGVLDRAARAGLIDIRATIARLRGTTFRADPVYFDELLRRRTAPDGDAR
jgi:predicted nucleic acid-binding protein